MRDTFDKVKMGEGRKAEIRDVLMHRKAGITHLGIKITAAAAALLIAAPLAVYAATNGEIIDRIWGNEGKNNVDRHTINYVDEGKVDEDGNTVTVKIEMPRIEYVSTDPEVAARLIGDRISEEPVSCTIGDTRFTVETVVRDSIGGIVASYTIEREGGVNCLNYSQLDNESKGAWYNPDNNIEFTFREGDGEIFVDLERSTDNKVYCYEYMHGYCGDHLTLQLQELTVSIQEMCDRINKDHKLDKKDFIKDEKLVTVPVADSLDSVTFTSASGDTVTASPISMKLRSTSGDLVADHSSYLVEGIELVDGIDKIKIIYNDGSEYVLFDDVTDNAAYTMEDVKGCYYALFNRLVDYDNIAKITVNDVVFMPD